MEETALQRLERRGCLQQSTDREGLERRMAEGPLRFYLGIDPTAPSLHAGHLVALITAARLGHAGHRPIFVLGCGTARIGDPSGKDEMRQLLSPERIERNALILRRQIEGLMGRFGIESTILDNADWLISLNYIDFLREIGRHFSVNRMLSFEGYRQRMEVGLSFIEFNYQLLQSYDFLMLYREHGCEMQIGGDDQWGNIISGVDLIRRIARGSSWGLTFPLLIDSNGRKMGKTERGALFLDAERTDPYDFFQYWRNIADSEVEGLLLTLTLLPDAQIAQLMAPGADINEAKRRLASAITSLIHGEEKTREIVATTQATFAGAGGERSALPATEVGRSELHQGIEVVSLFALTPLCASRTEARRLIRQGGAQLNGRRIDDILMRIDQSWLEGGELLLRAGKKRYHRITVSG